MKEYLAGRDRYDSWSKERHWDWLTVIRNYFEFALISWLRSGLRQGSETPVRSQKIVTRSIGSDQKNAGSSHCCCAKLAYLPRTAMNTTKTLSSISAVAGVRAKQKPRITTGCWKRLACKLFKAASQYVGDNKGQGWHAKADWQSSWLWKCQKRWPAPNLYFPVTSEILMDPGWSHRWNRLQVWKIPLLNYPVCQVIRRGLDWLRRPMNLPPPLQLYLQVHPCWPDCRTKRVCKSS